MIVGDVDWNYELSPPLRLIYILTLNLILRDPADLVPGISY